MALKLIEMTIGQDAEPFALDEMDQVSVLGAWSQELANDLRIVRVLVVGRQVEAIMDLLTEKYGDLEEFRTVVLPVEASLPRVQTDGRLVSDTQGKVYEPSDNEIDRMSREELYSTVSDSAVPTWSFLALTLMSSLVATVGVLRDNMAIVIGAMVIAPLLGPSIALALGTTLWDKKLIKLAVKATLYGVGLSYATAVLVGLFLNAMRVSWELSVRTVLTITDVILALVSGSAGVLAFTSRLSAALVGVMVAVALLPPLVTSGLLVAMGKASLSFSTMLLFLTNLICVNLSAVATFISQGIRPGAQDEKKQAGIAVTAAMIIWLGFLIALLVGIVYVQKDAFLGI